jgi:ABC-type glycerol-3-phosphate transport system substrate-binding protein
MIEIEFSTIPDSDVDLQVLTRLVDDFGRANQAWVKLTTMTWETAWTDLMTIASHGRGPHLSHIGGSWTSSLAMMNALRPFQVRELDPLGGPSAFMRPTWLSACLDGDKNCYALPWTGYIYVICYRRDLLRQVGIEESTAFGSISALSGTIKSLTGSSLEIPWLNPLFVAPYNDYLHTAASWVWGAGGRFLDDSGKRLVIDSPEALNGISHWLDTYRAVRSEHVGIDVAAGLDLFAQGKVAAILTDVRAASSFLTAHDLPFGRDALGVATLTEVPWCGGGNIVIWNHTRAFPEKEKIAVALAQHLTSHESELTWARQVGSMPSRLDVLEEIYPQGHPLHQAAFLAARQGLSYTSVPLWRRTEHQVALALHDILQDAYANPQKASIDIVRDHLQPMAYRLNLAFGG